MKKFELTPEQFIEFKKDLRSDMKMKDLANKHNISMQTLYNYRFKMRQETLSEDEICDLKKIRDERKFSSKQIQKKFNISWTTQARYYIEFCEKDGKVPPYFLNIKLTENGGGNHDEPK